MNYNKIKKGRPKDNPVKTLYFLLLGITFKFISFYKCLSLIVKLI